MTIASTHRRAITTARRRLSQETWSDPLLWAILLGFVGVVFVARYETGTWAALPATLFIAAGAMAVGAIVGFLFGIPRVAQASGSAAAGNWTDPQYQTNTNLEQISDWLTKIIIGLGLVELSRLYQHFNRVIVFTATALTHPMPRAVVGLLLVYFLIAGFLIAYLWTRILLTIEFSRADREARNSPEFYEGLIHALLYQDPPDGFTRALEAAEEFERRFGGGHWRVWQSLACAYAQKFEYLGATGEGNGEELKQARLSALSAVKRALAVNPDAKTHLQRLWDPGLVTRDEDDLKVFADDGDFDKVLGPKVGAAHERHA